MLLGVKEMTREQQAAYWRDLVEKQAESGLSAAAFCREHQIDQSQFYHWRRRFQSADTTGLSSFVQLVPCRNNASSGIVVRLGENLSIEVHQGFHPQTLREVIEICTIGA